MGKSGKSPQSMFQFYLSSIKSRDAVALAYADRCFNSTLVQLKEKMENWKFINAN